MTARADLEATIRAHVHPAGFGFWCTEGEDLPAELAGVLDAAGWVRVETPAERVRPAWCKDHDPGACGYGDGCRPGRKMADVALALLAKVDAAGVE